MATGVKKVRGGGRLKTVTGDRGMQAASGPFARLFSLSPCPSTDVLLCPAEGARGAGAASQPTPSRLVLT